MAVHVINESRRCLNCKKPQCQIGCPINTPIPDMIRLFREGHINSAGEMLFENNPLSVVCSLVCDHERQCEGHCVLGRKSSPVHISSIENYISDTYLDRIHPVSQNPSKKSVAIIGSGPAGITISVILAQRGYKITLFECKQEIGGVLRYGIPEFRLPKILLDRYKNILIRMGIKIRPNTAIGKSLTIDDLQRDGYQAIFIGTGVWCPKKLNIKGESLGHVHYAIDYLVNPDVYDLGNRLVVIGSGNSAMDVARTALRKGVRNVTILCRRDQISASNREKDYAIADGVEFVYGVIPIEITDEGVLCKETPATGKSDTSKSSESKLYPASSVVIAISQGAQHRIVNSTSGLAVNGYGLLEVDRNGNTSRPGIFAGGDVVLGARTVVEAVKCAKNVADSMDAYLQNISTSVS